MPLIYRANILRREVQDNPSWLFVFGDNALRKGLKGQAYEMRGEPNAIGIPTKWKPSMTPDAFFRDHQRDEIIELIEPDYQTVIAALEQKKTVVWPRDGIGTGLAGMPSHAPKLWAELEKIRLEILEKL